MNIKFTFKEGIVFSENEMAFLMHKSKTFGQVTIKTYTSRSGTIDLVSFIEVSFEFAVLKILNAFVKGFIGEDWFKNLGHKFRLEIEREMGTLKDFLEAYYDCFVRNQPYIQKAFVISEQIGDITLYIVINHFQMTNILLDKLPQSIVDTYGKISLGYFDIDSKICQLYPDFKQNEWRFLLTPTYNGLGNFVDRYYDLSSNKLIRIVSKEEFISEFDLIEEDRYKLIVNAILER